MPDLRPIEKRLEVTRVHTHVTWTKESQHAGVTHHFPEVPHFGDRPGAMHEGGHASLEQLRQAIEDGLDHHEIVIGDVTHHAHVSVESMMLVCHGEGCELNVGLRYTTADGRSYGEALSHEWAVLALDADALESLAQFHGTITNDAHARFGLSPQDTR